jgi:hypothetical protein
MAVGMGLTMAPATESVMGSLPREKAGVGSAVNDTTRQMGGALGVAIIGSLVASVYTARIDAAAKASGLSGAALDTARNSLGGALGLSNQLGAHAASFAQVAKEAFVSGLSGGLRLGAVVVLIAAVVAYRFLPARAHPEEPVVVAERFEEDGYEFAGAVGS